MLFDYEDGILTIRLRLTEQKNDWYADVLKGPLGQEEPTTILKKDYIGTSVRRCPTDPRPYPPENTSHIELRKGRNKPADGCIQTPNHHTYDGDWTYFRNDEKEVKLPVPYGDELEPYGTWVSWLNTYLMGNALQPSYGRGKRSGGGDGTSNSPTFKLLKPDGGLLILPPEEWGLNNAQPTRAGMAFSLDLPRNPSDHSGLYLSRDGEMVQIAEGCYIKSSTGTSLSPDGCKIAFRCRQPKPSWPPKIGGNFPPENLRVVDVCKGYHLAPDANPFVWK